MSRSPLLAPRKTRPALRKVHWQRTRAPRPWRAASAAKKPRRRLPVDRMARVQTRIDQWVADVRTAPRGRVMRRRLAHCCCPLGVRARPSGPLSEAVSVRARRPPPAKPRASPEIERRANSRSAINDTQTDVPCTTTAYSATKASFLSRTHMSLLCYNTPSHFLYSDKTNMCSPVRTLGVLPTYKHTSVRARKQAINCVQCPAC